VGSAGCNFAWASLRKWGSINSHFSLSEPSPQTLLSIKGTVKVIKKAPVSNLYININSYNTSTNAL